MDNYKLYFLVTSYAVLYGLVPVIINNKYNAYKTSIIIFYTIYLNNLKVDKK